MCADRSGPFSTGCAPDGSEIEVAEHGRVHCVTGVNFLGRATGLLLTASIVRLIAASTWLDVPFVHQTRTGCGAAAVAMVVGYWARGNPGLSAAAQDNERINDLLPSSAKGIRGRELKKYLEERGFSAWIFDGEISDLKNHFEKGRPVVVCLGPGGSKGPLHYAVVTGVEEGGVWLNDSARGKLIFEEMGQFQASWSVTGNWALLAVPRQAQ